MIKKEEESEYRRVAYLTIDRADLIQYLEFCRNFARNTDYPFVANMRDGSRIFDFNEIIEQVKYRKYKTNKIDWLGSKETGECLYQFNDDAD